MKLALMLAAAAAIAPQVFAQTVQPYQQSRFVNAGSCPNKQCVLSFSTIPPGKRLVLASISAQVGAGVDTIVLEGNGVSYFVAKANPGGTYLSQPITLYFEPGTTPTARIFAGASTQSASFAVTIIGTLVPSS